jgi:hypothetical protein
MIKHSRNIILSTAFLAGLLFMSGCDKLMDQGTGFLEGVISIGPICPVETVPPDPACLPTAETYKAYPVSIWTSNGRKKIAQINPALDGTYKAKLESGNYLVILGTGNNRVSESNLPAEVKITSQNNTILNINIDTGIR